MGKPVIAVALSGGVDSSVTAALLQQQGYDVVGVTLQMRHPDPEFSARQSCGVKQDLEAIELVTKKLNIPHHTLKRYPEFEAQVLRHSWEQYANGHTPNPCCRCNHLIKFGELIKFAKSIGAEALATGHYANLTKIDQQQRLLRGKDLAKDQSYFLYNLTCEQLNFIRFPVGEMAKDEVKKIAQELGMKSISQKKESQDACFSADNECFAETLRRVFKAQLPNGVFVHNNRVVGTHSGIHRFTLGQRKGLNVALGVPGYVKKIEVATGIVELTTDEKELDTNRFEVSNVNFHSPMPIEPFECLIQVRYRSKAQLGLVIPQANNRCIVELKESARAVSSGQAAVF